MTDGALLAASGSAADLTEIARQLRNLRHVHREQGRLTGDGAFPRRDNIVRATTLIPEAMFPRRIGAFSGTVEDEDEFVENRLQQGLRMLASELEIEAIHWKAPEDKKSPAERVSSVVRTFVASLPRVRILLESDIEAAFLCDPTARTIEEILVSYPGAHAILWHRIAHEIHRLDYPIVARIMSAAAYERSGIDIHPGAEIGPAFFIDHGSGVVIGETTVIGARVQLYQQVARCSGAGPWWRSCLD